MLLFNIYQCEAAYVERKFTKKKGCTTTITSISLQTAFH